MELPAERDLTLIFERDDVHVAFAMHCRENHQPGDTSCQRCNLFRALLADAILTWHRMATQDNVRTIADLFRGTEPTP